MRTTAQPSPWDLLGVPPGADRATIKQAYRRLALLHHPDRDPSPDANDRFRRVHAAYRTLLSERTVATGPAQRAAPHPPVMPRRRTERPATASERFIFRALHATGLCFGLSLVLSVGMGIVFLRLGNAHLLLALPGLAILPDSLHGLGLGMKKAGQARPSMRS